MAITLNGTTGITTPGLIADSPTLTVDSANNRVGIGTATPSNELDVYGSGTVALFSGSGGSGFIGIQDRDDGTLGFIGVDGGNLKFQTPGSSYSDKLVITSAGNVGIGTNNPGRKLHIVDRTTPTALKIGENDEATNEAALEIQARNTANTSGYTFVLAVNADEASTTFDFGGTEKLRILSTGKVMMGQSHSSINRNLSITAEPGNSNVAELGLQPTNSSGGINPETIIRATADGTYGAHMGFWTRDTSGNRSEKLRIASDGKISIAGDNNSYLYRSALNTWTFSLNSVDTFRLYEDTAWILSNNITPNPNNTGSEIQGAMLRFGNNIWLQERYPNGAYSDRQDLVLNTDSGYGLGQSDKVRFISDGSIDLNQHYSSAPSNSARSSPNLKFKGYGWNTGTGSEEVGTRLQSQHAYWSGNYSNVFGQTYPDFKILIKNSDSSTYDEKFAFSGNGVMRLQSGGGINFHAHATSGNPSSNLLDDYEEGTWTPIVTNLSGSTSFNAAPQNTTGYYIKVGSKVTAWYYSSTFNVNTNGSGAAVISGFPFNSTNQTNSYAPGIMTHTNCFASDVENGYLSVNNNYFVPTINNSTGSTTWTTGATVYFMVSVTYWAA